MGFLRSLCGWLTDNFLLYYRQIDAFRLKDLECLIGHICRRSIMSALVGDPFQNALLNSQLARRCNWLPCGQARVMKLADNLGLGSEEAPLSIHHEDGIAATGVETAGSRCIEQIAG